MRNTTAAILIFGAGTAFLLLSLQQLVDWPFPERSEWSRATGGVTINPKGVPVATGPGSAIQFWVTRTDSAVLSLASALVCGAVGFGMFMAVGKTAGRIRGPLLAMQGCLVVMLHLWRFDRYLSKAVMVAPAGAPGLEPWWAKWDLLIRLRLDPTYDLGLALGLFLILLGVHLWRKAKEYPAGFCQACGYNLTGNVSGICPECGAKALQQESA